VGSGADDFPVRLMDDTDGCRHTLATYGMSSFLFELPIPVCGHAGCNMKEIFCPVFVGFHYMEYNNHHLIVMQGNLTVKKTNRTDRVQLAYKCWGSLLTYYSMGN